MDILLFTLSGLIMWMPSSSTTPVTRPNSVNTPTCPVGTEVTEDHNRMNSTIPRMILPMPMASQFLALMKRNSAPGSPDAFPRMLIFASVRFFRGREHPPAFYTPALLAAQKRRRTPLRLEEVGMARRDPSLCSGG